MRKYDFIGVAKKNLESTGKKYDFLEATKKYGVMDYGGVQKPMTDLTVNNGSGRFDSVKTLGKITEAGYNAIQDNKLDGYEPFNDEERKTIEAYKSYKFNNVVTNIERAKQAAGGSMFAVNSAAKGIDIPKSNENTANKLTAKSQHLIENYDINELMKARYFAGSGGEKPLENDDDYEQRLQEWESNQEHIKALDLAIDGILGSYTVADYNDLIITSENLLSSQSLEPATSNLTVEKEGYQLTDLAYLPYAIKTLKQKRDKRLSEHPEETPLHPLEYFGKNVVHGLDAASTYTQNAIDWGMSWFGSPESREATNEGIEQRTQELGERGAAIEKRRPNMSKAVNAFIRDAGRSSQMAPTVLTTAANPFLGTAYMAGESFGGNYGEALVEGADLTQAFKYAAGATTIEVGIEKLLGNKLFGGDTVLDKATTKAIKKVAHDPGVQAAVKFVVDCMGEGSEEVVTEMLLPIVKRATYSDTLEMPTADELIDTFWAGFTGSAVWGGAAAGARRIYSPKGAAPSTETTLKAPRVEQPTLKAPISTEVSGTAQNANAESDTSTMPNVETHNTGGIFDRNVGTKSNVATQQNINDYVDYAYRYADETNNKGNKEIPKQKASIVIGKTDERLVTDLQEYFGVDVSGAYHTLNDNDIRHIKNSHGEQTNEKYPVTAEDLKQIPNIINNYDDVLYAENGGKKGIYYVKRHNGVTYYLEAINESGKVLSNKQMIKVATGTIPNIAGLKDAINKKWNISSAPDDSRIPRMYVQDVWSDNVPNNNIPQKGDTVNNQYMQNDADVQNTKPTMEVQDAQMYNIVTSNLIRKARENNLDLQTFYAETENVNAYSLTAQDIQTINNAFAKMYGNNVDDITRGNLNILNNIANKYPVDTNSSQQAETAAEGQNNVLNNSLNNGIINKEPVYEAYQANKPIGSIDYVSYGKKIDEAKATYNLTSEESAGIEQYVGGMAFELNGVLLGNPNYESTPFTDYWIENIVNGLKKMPSYEGRTYRNLSFNNQEELQVFLNQFKTGGEVTLDNFSSTSKDPNGYTVSGDYVVHMVFDGVNGKDISDSFSLPEQQEVIFLPGTKVNVETVKTANDGYDLIYVKEAVTNGKNLETDNRERFEGSTGTDFEGQRGNASGKGNDLGAVYEYGGIQGNGREVGAGEVLGTNDQKTSEQRWVTKRENKSSKGGRSIGNIVDYIRNAFDIPISSGKVENPNARGIYKERAEAIRTRISNNLPTISHELGHHLDKLYKLSSLPSIDDLIANCDQDFLNLYRAEERSGEAVAEFIREYLKNTNNAKNMSPQFYGDFLNAIGAEDLKNLNIAADYVNTYMSSDFSERVQASIVSSKKSMLDKFKDFSQHPTETMKEEYDKRYTEWVDAFYPQKQAMDYVKEVKGENIDGSKDAYVLATNSLNSATIANHIVTKGMTDMKGNTNIGKSLLECIKEVKSKDLNAFDRYLVLNHGLEWLHPKNGKIKRVFADETLQDIDNINKEIAKLEQEHPEFKEAANNVYEYQRNVLKYFVVDAGGMSYEGFKKLQNLYPKYVPFNRDVNNSKQGKTKGTFANQKAPFKRAKGSGLDIISPLESIIMNTEKMVKFAQRNQVMKVWSEYADTVDGFGKFMEKVAPDMLPHAVDLAKKKGKIFEYLEEHMNASDYITLTDAIDDILGDKAIGFSPIANANKRIVSVLKNGEMQYYQIHDEDFYNSIANMSPQQAWGLHKWSARFMNPMKVLTTQNNPVFAGTNAIRDIGTSYRNSIINNPAEFIARYVSSLAGIITKSDNWKKYQSMGGGHSSELSASIKDIKNTLRKVRDKGKAQKILSGILHPIQTVASFNDIIESVPRFMEFKKTLDSGGDTQQAIYRADDITTNFKRGGYKAKNANDVILYFNAALQGIDKMTRSFKDVSPKQRAARVTKYVTVALMMTALQGLFNHDDEEEYNNLSAYKKNNFYNFSIGDGYFVSIPKARELALLDSTAERIAEYVFGNKEAFEGFGGYVLDSLVLPGLPKSGGLDGVQDILGDTVFGPLVDVIANEDFKGSPIESYSDEYLRNDYRTNEIYSESTTKFAKWLGNTGIMKNWEISPKQIDHIINNYTGVIGQINRALFPVNEENRDKTIGLKNKFVSDSYYSTDVLNDVYDTRDASKKEYRKAPTFNNAAEFEKNSLVAEYATNLNKTVKALPKAEQREGRKVMVDAVNSWDYDTGFEHVADGSNKNVAEDFVSVTLPDAELEYTHNKKKYAYTFTPNEYKDYVDAYMKLLEEERREASIYKGKDNYEELLQEADNEAMKEIKAIYKKYMIQENKGKLIE